MTSCVVTPKEILNTLGVFPISPKVFAFSPKVAMLVNFITTLSAATGSAVIMITSCVVENSLTCDIQAVDK